MGPVPLWKALALQFTKCILIATVPNAWNKAVIILLHKKGDMRKLDNYRPISLLSHVYELSRSVIFNRLSKKLDEYQPRQQADFGSGFSTSDLSYRQTLNTTIEKCHDYRKSLITFVDYEKAFNSVENWPVKKALVDCRIDERYIKLIHNYSYIVRFWLVSIN